MRPEGAQDPLGRATTLGKYKSPEIFYMNRDAMNLPEVEGQAYWIKPNVIKLVSQNSFHGLPLESPMDHIDAIEELCSMIKTN